MQQSKWHKTILQNQTHSRSARLMSTKPAKRNTNCLEDEWMLFCFLLLYWGNFSSVLLYWYCSSSSAMLVHRCIRPRFAPESSRKSLHSWNWPDENKTGGNSFQSTIRQFSSSWLLKKQSSRPFSFESPTYDIYRSNIPSLCSIVCFTILLVK